MRFVTKGFFNLFFLLPMISAVSQSDKPLLDSASYKRWTTVYSPAISNDGQFIMYTLNNEPVGGKTLIVRDTSMKWSRRYTNVENPRFSGDSKYILFLKSGHLIIASLGKNKTDTISGTRRFEILNKDKTRWLVAQGDTSTAFISLTGNQEYRFDGKLKYSFCERSGFLLVQSISDSISNEEIILIDIVSGKRRNIFLVNNVRNVVFSEKGLSIAFLTGGGTSRCPPEIWIYEVAKGKVNRLQTGNNIIPNSFYVSDVLKFSEDESIVYLTLKKHDNADIKRVTSNVNIWSYKDLEVQSAQLKSSETKDFLFALRIKDLYLLRLQYENERRSLVKEMAGEWLRMSAQEFVNGVNTSSEFIVSVRTGKRRYFPTTSRIYASPGNKYIVYFDEFKNGLFCHNVEANTTILISSDVGIHWQSTDFNDADWDTKDYRGLAGWMISANAVLFYDRYDIWQLDLEGKKKPLNLTNFFGRRNRIVFKIVPSDSPVSNFLSNSKIFLAAFEKKTKENGFYTVVLGKNTDPCLLSKGPFIYWQPHTSSVPIVEGFPPVKARNRNVYLVLRMSSRESPNYFITNDFVVYKQMSFNYPERKYNWFTTELHSWSRSDGVKLDGILYKPENFDPKRKYPVIFTYYRKLAYNLNAYLVPGFPTSALNIPWYASNGYLVLALDMVISYGDVGESALQCISSAVEYLKKYSYVDSSKLGIQGSSFGGFLTNYIVTHTGVFAAACSTIGIYDLISAYNSISVDDGKPKQMQFEFGPYHIGGTPWDNQAAYLLNSPILYAHKVKTPFLMLNNPADPTIPMSGAIEFYLALRRLGKRVWMLEYENGGHGVIGLDAEDFDIRRQQFFNHYLKGAPPPKWMTEGRPAYLKHIDDRLELDSTGAIP